MTLQDLDIWYEFIKSVKKLSRKKIHPVHPNIKRLIKNHPIEIIETFNSDLKVVYLSKNERRNFRSEASIDLHGHNRDISEILKVFCLDCIERKIKNVIVITGKGESIIKRAVLQWIESNSTIIVGFFEIMDRRGGSGSVGIKLRLKLFR
ncbi:MAG: Smr/MutS family protein [Holosporales bacterium]|jgi:DNA-nicking Smr family endonuclease|nr:Smr/MutS family protein [Holosporales bacterium]